MAQLKETTINGNLHLKGEDVKIYVNDTEFQGGGGSGTSVQSDWNATEATNGAIKNKPPIEKGVGDNVIQQIPETETWDSTNLKVQEYINNDIGTADDETQKIRFTSNGPTYTVIVGAYGTSSTMTGGKSQNVGKKSHTEGSKNIAFESNAHAEGNETFAAGKHSHAEGNLTSAIGNSAHAEGNQGVALADNSHVEGVLTETKKDAEAAHAEGRETQAMGPYSHAEGGFTQAQGQCSHAEGNTTIAEGNNTHAEGKYTHALGDSAHAEGYSANVSGIKATEMGSHAEGYNESSATITASNKGAHAGGCIQGTSATGSIIASGLGSFAHGLVSYANGNIQASGSGSASGGYTTSGTSLILSGGNGSVAWGMSTPSYDGLKATGSASAAFGYGTQALSNYQFVHGQGNLLDKKQTYIHIVGNGLGASSRSNAYTLTYQGAGMFAQSVGSSTGADYAEYFEWLDGNLNNEDRVGLLVTLNGEQIELANPNDDILGIVSANPAVIGDVQEWQWQGKYLTDDFGRIQYEEVEQFVDEIITNEETNEIIIEKKSLGLFKQPIINPNYDESQEYVNRANRPEWDTIGMLGKLYLRDDGTCIPNFYATVGENGVATSSLEKTNMRVLSRVNDNIVRVLLK